MTAAEPAADFRHPTEFRRWAAGEPQTPIAELLAEHHVMARVLDAMEAEATAMNRGRPLRLEFWAGLIEFVQAFVQESHRVKEEQHLFPHMSEVGTLPEGRAGALEREHGQARQITERLCRLAEAGDWEGVVRLSALYLHVIRPHMRREEVEWTGPAPEGVTDADLERIRQSFVEVERAAFGTADRAHWIGLVDRVCGMAQVRGLADG